MKPRSVKEIYLDKGMLPKIRVSLHRKDFKPSLCFDLKECVYPMRWLPSRKQFVDKTHQDKEADKLVFKHHGTKVDIRLASAEEWEGKDGNILSSVCKSRWTSTSLTELIQSSKIWKLGEIWEFEATINGDILQVDLNPKKGRKVKKKRSKTDRFGLNDEDLLS